MNTHMRGAVIHSKFNVILSSKDV